MEHIHHGGFYDASACDVYDDGDDDDDVACHLCQSPLHSTASKLVTVVSQESFPHHYPHYQMMMSYHHHLHLT